MELKSIRGAVLFALDTAKTIAELVVAAVKINQSLRGADLRGAYLRGADLHGAYLHGAYLQGAYLQGAELRGANLRGAELRGAEGKKKPIRDIRIFSGLYVYEVWAVLFEDGTRSIRMGCLWKSLAEWEKIGIRNSNLSEFPNDASPKCEDRAAAFNFAKAAVLRMKLPEVAKPAATKAAEKARTK